MGAGAIGDGWAAEDLTLSLSDNGTTHDTWLMTHLSHETYTVPTRPQPVPPLIAYL